MKSLKYSLGSKVLVQFMGNNWVGDYQTNCTIIGFATYCNNGRPVFTVKEDHSGQIYHDVDSERFTLIK